MLRNYYYVLAIGSALVFGINNFCMEYTLEDSLDVKYIWFGCPGYIFFYLAYHATMMINSKRNSGVFWTRENSAYFRKDTLTVDWGNITGVAIRSIISLLVVYFQYGLVYYSVTSGVSNSVIISILTCTAFLTALIFYLVFKENLAIKHFIGMICLMGSVLFISIKSDDKNTDLL